RGSDGKVTGLSLKFNPGGNVKSTKKKVTWLALDPQRPLVDMTLLDFDYLINKKKIEEDDDIMDFLTEQTRFETAAVADPNCAELKKGDVIQLERKGFYIVDRVAADSKSGKIELIFIPDGKAKSIASKASGNSSSK
ncbi:glutamate--tRNA ligase, partial [Spiromyces aspiralis]